MNFTANAFSVTTALLIAFALFVIYTRIKNWLDSNVPLIYYIIMIVYVKSQDQIALPLWLVLTSFALTLTLRFEFMNQFFIKVVKLLEMATLAWIIYISLTMILS